MKYFAEAMKEILPMEHILKVGKPIPSSRLVDEKKAVFVKGVESDGDAVTLISEYSDRKAAPQT